MSALPFIFTSTNSLVAQPNEDGEKIIIRSTDAADTMSASVVGLVAAVNTAESKTLTGQREVQTTALFESLTLARVASTAAGVVTFLGQGTAAEGRIIVTTQPADADTVIIGLTGFTQAYRFKNTTLAAYDVKIGADATATALNLKKAINADGLGDGTDYHTGTAANPYMSAIASGIIVTPTDRIAVNRQLVWSFTQGVGATLSLQIPIGGDDGVLLSGLNPGDISTFDSFSLDDEALTEKFLPALFTGRSDWMAVDGRPIFQLRCENVANAIAVIYEISNDETNYLAGTTSISNLDNNVQHIEPAELAVSSCRLSIVTNANTTDSAVNAKVLS